MGWLTGTGRLDPDTAPASRVTRAAVAAYVADLRLVNAPLTVVGRVAALAKMLGWFAPEQDWSWLRVIVTRLQARVGTAPQDRKRARLRSAHELLALELVRRGEGWWIEIPGADTKTGAPLEQPWPEELVPALATYLASWRPRLAQAGRSAGCSVLWLGNRGRGLSCQQVYSKIVAHTGAAFGQPVNPHLFRDAAATTMARDRPQQVRLAAPLLGHRRYTTTERHYILAQSNEAATALHAVLAKLADER